MPSIRSFGIGRALTGVVIAELFVIVRLRVLFNRALGTLERKFDSRRVEPGA